MKFKIGDLVNVYGGCTLHCKHPIFSNGCEMQITDMKAEWGAEWVLCLHDDRNEGTQFSHWFLQQQLRVRGDE